MLTNCSRCGAPIKIYKKRKAPICGKCYLDPIKRFFWKVEKTSSCWLWRGPTSTNGYGHLGYQGRTISAHRFSWLIHKGAIPEGQYVLHRCDVRNCVNPSHLFLGSQQDNSQDAIKKGRWIVGEKNPAHKLSNALVKEIRATLACPITHDVALRYNVTKATLRNVLVGKTWAHLR